jgi:CMP-N-acetylneuraminic acid synthetase
MTDSVTALVPMRHHSERVAGKNYRPFAGRPLYHHIVESLRSCSSISEILIDTDSPAIMEDAGRHFPSVRLLERPEHLRAGTIPMNDILLYDVQHTDAQILLQTHSTNPLLRATTIEEAVKTFLSKYPKWDTLFSVTRLHTRLWDKLGRPINHNPHELLRTQDLPPVYEENSCIYIFPRTVLEQRRNRMGERPYLFEIESMEAVDIDEESDFILAEQLYQWRAGVD